MKKVYLQLEFMTGKMFEYSKEEKEEFEKVTSKTGNVSYRKYYRGVTGELESVSIRDAKFGQEIGLGLKDGDTVYYFSISLMDQKGFVDNAYAEDFIVKTPNLNRGEVYSINSFRFTPEESKYDKTGISIKQGSLKVEKAYTNSYVKKDGEKVEGDIPSVVWKKDATGKNKPSAASKEVRSEKMLEILVEQAERLKWVGSNNNATSYGNNPAPQVESAPKATVTEQISETEDEDETLPF